MNCHFLDKKCRCPFPYYSLCQKKRTINFYFFNGNHPVIAGQILTQSVIGMGVVNILNLFGCKIFRHFGAIQKRAEACLSRIIHCFLEGSAIFVFTHVSTLSALSKKCLQTTTPNKLSILTTPIHIISQVDLWPHLTLGATEK